MRHGMSGRWIICGELLSLFRQISQLAASATYPVRGGAEALSVIMA